MSKLSTVISSKLCLQGADAIIMKWIVHDWNEEQSVAIMKNCHRALPENGKLILIEAVVPAR